MTEDDEDMVDYLSLPPFRPWYRFGSRSPRILIARFRNKHQFVFRLRMSWQRATQQFSDDQLWGLSHSSAQLIVAGIKKLRECANGYPMEFTLEYGNGEEWEGWELVLAEIEEGFQVWLDTDGWFGDDKKGEKKYNRALKLFARWHGALWA